MIQLEQQQHGEFVCGVVGGWLTPTTYIQLAGAGSLWQIVFYIGIIGNIEKLTQLRCFISLWWWWVGSFGMLSWSIIALFVMFNWVDKNLARVSKKGAGHVRMGGGGGIFWRRMITIINAAAAWWFIGLIVWVISVISLLYPDNWAD